MLFLIVFIVGLGAYAIGWIFGWNARDRQRQEVLKNEHPN